MKKYTELAMLLAISIVVSILESFIPTFVPGAKLGLANIIILIVLYVYSFKDSLLLLLMRILLVSFWMGTFLSITFYMSLSGGITAILTMLLFKKLKIFNIISVSVTGALMHGVGQIAVAMIVIAKESVFYLPIIMVLSILTGMFTGFVAKKYLSIRNKELDV